MHHSFKDKSVRKEKPNKKALDPQNTGGGGEGWI